jgi:hypothetical protein
MTTVCYPSLDDAEVIQVEFLTLQGSVRSLKLLVDSGFTGRSSVVLGDDASDLVRAEIPAAQAIGALQGAQNRAWVTCRIPELSFQSTVIAIITDLTPLSLPPDLKGMAGLTFLRQFARWGAERTKDGWQLSLSNPGSNVTTSPAVPSFHEL